MLLAGGLFAASLPLSAQVCDPGFQYRVPVTLTNSGSALSNYQVRLTVNTSTLISAGKMNGSGNDIRFFDGSCNAIPYWIESGINTASTSIWIRVASLPVGNTTINMYYGNPFASAASNASAVYDIYDDFNGSSLNTSIWQVFRATASTVTVGGGVVTFATNGSSGDAMIRTNSTFNGSICEMSVTSVSTASAAYTSLGVMPQGSVTGVHVYGWNFTPSTRLWAFGQPTSAGCNSYNTTGGSGYSNSTMAGLFTLAWTGTNQGYWDWAGVGGFAFSSTPTMPSAQQAWIGLTCGSSSGSTMSVDWFRVRKFAASVPTFSLGSEVVNYNMTVDGLYDMNSNLRSSFCGNEYFMLYGAFQARHNSAGFAYVELSDAAGSFSSPTTLWQASFPNMTYNLGPNVYLLFLQLPNNLPYGTGYRIRWRSVDLNYSGPPSSAITLGARPTSTNFTINNAAQCNETDNFTFTGQGSIATGNTRSLRWDFGDSTSSTTSPVSKGYVWPGTKTVKFVAFNSSMPRCADSVSRNVTVYPQPLAQIFHNDQCQQDDNLFASWGSGVGVGSWLTTENWNFGDNTSVTTGFGNTQYKKYSTHGSYTVRLIVTSNFGCRDTATVTHHVFPRPIVNFTTDLACDGREVQFRDLSTIPNFRNTRLNSYYYQFGDGGESYDKNPARLFSGPGTYSVRLYIYSEKGCWDTIRKNVVVNPTPKALFTADASCMNAVVPIRNLSTLSSGTMSYRWNLGNGSGSTQQVPTPSYNPSGTYTIKLYTTANTGCMDSTQRDVVIHSLPTAQFDADDVCNGKTTAFTNFSAGASSYMWTMEPGITSTDKNPSHTFSADGTWPVKLLAMTSFGCKDSITKDVNVWPNPVASFNVNNLNQCLRGNRYVFNNTSSIGSGSMTHAWAFGDGTVSPDLSPVKNYNAAGSFSARLTVTSDKGCTASATAMAQVRPMPVSNFSFNNSCAGASVAFSNLSSIAGGTNSYNWSFGDGNTASSVSPSNTYSAAGNYNVRLIAISNFSCRDTSVKVYTAWPNPTVDFTSAAVCNGLPTQFTNASSVSSGFMAGYSWNFGNSRTSNEINPEHVYAAHGNYNVSLTGTTDKGCSATAIKAVDVWPQPVASYTATNVCLGKQTAFASTSSIPAGSISSFDWTFGDAATGSGATIGHTYTAFGRYSTSLKVTSDKGCVSIANKDVSVYRQPDARIWSSTGKTSVLNPVVNFADNSLYGDLSDWNFGFGGRTSTNNTDTVSYTKAGTYNVRLISTSSEGCTDTARTTVEVENGYTMFFPTAFTPNGDNLNDGFGAVGVFEGIKAYKLTVLDNRGRVIFSTTDLKVKWNGKLENTGETMEAGNFAWFAEYTDYKNTTHRESGQITLRK